MSAADALHMLVFDLLARRPAAARVFIERGMGCVGCTFARFETVSEVAAVYGCDADDLARALTADRTHLSAAGGHDL